MCNQAGADFRENVVFIPDFQIIIGGGGQCFLTPENKTGQEHL
jgi:hypothetical protein